VVQDVEARLEAALGRARAEPVDSESLLRGARLRAARVRRRRSAGVVVALVVVVAPLGWGAAGNLSLPGSAPGQDAGASADLRTGAQPQSSPETSGSAVSIPSLTTAVPSPTPFSARTTTDLSTVLLSESDLPQGWTEIPSSGTPYIAVPAQRCPTAADDELEGAAQRFVGVTEQETLQASATAWPAGTGPREYARAEQNTGACTFLDDGVQQTWAPAGGGPGFSRTWREGDVDNALAVVLVQDTLVGVWTQGSAGGAGVETLAKQGAEVIAGRVRAGG